MENERNKIHKEGEKLKFKKNDKNLILNFSKSIISLFDLYIYFIYKNISKSF
jgi:hypothetical protein